MLELRLVVKCVDVRTGDGRDPLKKDRWFIGRVLCVYVRVAERDEAVAQRLERKRTGCQVGGTFVDFFTYCASTNHSEKARCPTDGCTKHLDGALNRVLLREPHNYSNPDSQPLVLIVIVAFYRSTDLTRFGTLSYNPLLLMWTPAWLSHLGDCLAEDWNDLPRPAAERCNGRYDQRKLEHLREHRDGRARVIRLQPRPK